ncbi:MAG: riboflavin synthase [Immundisolibacterales bacterium]|nr:riboflavin synthase [Immundisolibacterales bacterium]
MFTGIVQTRGAVRHLESRNGDRRLEIDAPKLGDFRTGDSICVSGACLTAVARTPQGFLADVSRETLEHTTLGDLRPGAAVNLELSLTPETVLGGHLVTGHVDGVAELLSQEEDARSQRLRLRVPDGLERYVASKGSICVDGVSLTVNEVDGREFGVNIIPHTAEATTLGEARPGTRFNLEVDLIARYVERLLRARETGP